MPYEITIRRRVEFSETDMAGIVHYSNFFRYMEAAEHAYEAALHLRIETREKEVRFAETDAMEEPLRARTDAIPCRCGRTHRRITRNQGRSDDMLIIRGVNVYPSQIEAVLVGLPGIAPHYQLVLERRGALDEVTLEVEALPAVAEADYSRLAADAAHHIKSHVGVTATVKVLAPGAVPRSQGKAVRVRDLRPKAAPSK